MSNQTRTAKARLAAATRHHPNRDHTALQRDLAAAKLDSYIQRVLAEAPPLTPEQLSKVALLLRPSKGGDIA